MNTSRKYSLLSLILALVLAFSLAGCATQPAPVPEESLPSQVDINGLEFMNPLRIPEGSELQDVMPNLIPKIMEKDALNSDTVGWLQIPNTTVDDVVVQNPSDPNNSSALYLRKDFDKRDDNNGTYFVDYRSNIDGTREALSTNTIIYGHSMSDNNEGVLLDQMKKFRASEDFAKENPYVFFSLEGENLMWEVFAVFDSKVDFHYNNPKPTADELSELVSEAVKRSYFLYDVQVTSSDKILTISTCTYNYVNIYPNDYRYVVMARLVSPDEIIKESAVLEVNADRKLP